MIKGREERLFVGITNVVLLAQLLAKGSAHDDTALARAGLEVSGTALAPGGVSVCSKMLI